MEKVRCFELQRRCLQRVRKNATALLDDSKQIKNDRTNTVASPRNGRPTLQIQIVDCSQQQPNAMKTYEEKKTEKSQQPIRVWIRHNRARFAIRKSNHREQWVEPTVCYGWSEPTAPFRVVRRGGGELAAAEGAAVRRDARALGTGAADGGCAVLRTWAGGGGCGGAAAAAGLNGGYSVRCGGNGATFSPVG